MPGPIRGAAISFCVPLILPILFLLFWEISAYRMSNPTVLPSTRQVLAVISQPLSDLVALGSLASNLGISLARVLCGFLAATLVGVPLGLAMGYSLTLDRLFVGIVALLRSIPPLAWVPLLLAWCGMVSLGSLLAVPVGPLYSFANNIKISMIGLIFIGGFYPVLTSAVHGVRQVPAALLDASRVLGASRRDIFFKVLWPASVPDIVSGLRIGLGVCWTCLVSAEMLPGSPSGLGFLITHAYALGRTDVVISGMVCIGLTGAVLDWIFRTVEDRKFAWKRLRR